jgi:glycosyltransferase involved in cell wall biosynthesis
MKELSILIPARNEMFLTETVNEILANSSDYTDVIVILDGAKEVTPLPENKRLAVVRLGEPIGQRASQNLACRMSTARYVMKLDAHCAVDKDFDKKMLEAFEKEGSGVVMVPIMRNLHVFNWKCKNGHERYQGRSGNCEICGEETFRDIVWIPKDNPQSKSFCFDSEPHFQYFNEYKHTDAYKKMFKRKRITETMSLQGSCIMVSREDYWKYNICDESLGSWGSQGIEVATKMWLCGGRVLVNHDTWYAHLFRTQGGDFSFPYKQSEAQVQAAKAKMRDILYKNKLPNQIHPLHWLIEKFYPVKGWTDMDIKLLKEGKL